MCLFSWNMLLLMTMFVSIENIILTDCVCFTVWSLIYDKILSFVEWAFWNFLGDNLSTLFVLVKNVTLDAFIVWSLISNKNVCFIRWGWWNFLWLLMLLFVSMESVVFNTCVCFVNGILISGKFFIFMNECFENFLDSWWFSFVLLIEVWSHKPFVLMDEYSVCFGKEIMLLICVCFTVSSLIFNKNICFIWWAFEIFFYSWWLFCFTRKYFAFNDYVLFVVKN